jgi:hypothetical protein
VFKTKERARAETAAARIDLATTVLVVDAAGAYRGLQEYRVTNATEQFLEIQLPEGARLWTATVAGQPVKPVIPPTAAVAATARQGIVRIPLVKTAEGEGDYPVQLKYGGQMSQVMSLAQVRFPLMKTVNINVELSQVKLHLPDNYDWSSYFEFGGTMRPVADESELSEVFQSYLNKRINEAKELLASANPYTQIRAQSNLKQSALLFDNSRSMSSNNLRESGLELQNRNDVLLREAEQQVQQQQAAQQADAGDNRSRLNSYWSEQDVKRSKNVVSGLKSNFDGVQDGRESKAKEGTFNPAWFDQNALGTKGEGDKSGVAAAKKPGDGKQVAGGKPGGRYSRGAGKNFADDNAQPQDQAGEQGYGQAGRNPQLANEQQRAQLQQKLQKDADEGRSGESSSREQDRESLSRYGQNLDRNTQQQEFGGLAGQQPNLPPGQSMAPGGGPASGSGGGMGGGFFGGAQGGADLRYAAPGLRLSNGQAADPFAAPTTGSATASTTPAAPVAITGDVYENVAAGLASLDFRLPERGSVYSFTTPRGQIEITARPVAHTLIGRLIGLAALAAVVLIIWAASRQPAREGYARLFSTVASGVLLAIVGLASLIIGVFPVAGLVLVVIGIVLAIRNRVAPALAT